MTDRELTILAAEKVMRWRVETRPSGNVVAIAPDDTRVWIATVNARSLLRAWEPLESDADALMLVDALDPTDFSLEKSGLNWTAQFSTGCATASDRRRAIVLACLRARSEWRR